MIELEKEFENDFILRMSIKLQLTDNVSVISIIGQDLSTFHKLYIDKKTKLFLFFQQYSNG
jgi:aspartokinase/homoserine dehydrogenase 1